MVQTCLYQVEHVKRRFLEAAVGGSQQEDSISGIPKRSPPSRSIWTVLDCPSTRVSPAVTRLTQKHDIDTQPIVIPGMKTSVNRGHQQRVYRVNLDKFLSHPQSSFPLRTSLSNRRTPFTLAT